MILYFHRLTKKSENEDPYIFGDDIPIDNFIRGITSLRGNGYSFVSLKDYLEAPWSNTKISITFDDADISIFNFKKEIKDLDIPITIFSPTAALRKGVYFDETKFNAKHPYTRRIYKQLGPILRKLLYPDTKNCFSQNCLSPQHLKILHKELGSKFAVGGHGEYHIKHSWINSFLVPSEISKSFSDLKDNEFFFHGYAYPYGTASIFARKTLSNSPYKFGFATENGGNDSNFLKRYNGTKILTNLLRI